MLYVMPKLVLQICPLSSRSKGAPSAAVTVPLSLPRAAPASGPPLARLRGDQLLGNRLRCQDRHCSAGSRQARLVIVIKSSEIQNMLSSVRNKEQLKFH